MNRVAATIVEAVLLLAMSAVVGFGINTVRDRDHIQLDRNYSTKVDLDRIREARNRATDQNQPARMPTDDGSAAQPPGSQGDARPPVAEEPNVSTSTPSERVSTSTGEPDTPADPNVTENGEDALFQTVELDEVVELWKSPGYEYGAVVFVDARSTEPFRAGHIPGAIQCDYYRWPEDADEVIPRAIGAEKVVVYCNGADCEDSLAMCAKLLENDIPWHVIYLFKGGWVEWSESDMPAATGSGG